MSIIRVFQSALGIQAKANIIENEMHNLTGITADILKYNAISCRCGSIRIPTGEVGNTYKCINCSKESIKNKYNLGDRSKDDSLNISPKKPNQVISMDHYDAAVRLLKKDSEIKNSMK